MNPTRILAIAPYEGLREVLLAEAARRDDIALDVYLGDLADGVSIVAALEDKGYDIVLSRGGTAKQIERATHLPVVDIVPSVYDLLRYVRLAESMTERFAVVGFSNITRTADKLFDLIQRKIDIVTLGDAADAEPVIRRLMDAGCTLLVGDAIATATAKRLHMNSILIASGGESVQTALAEAVRTHQVIRAALSRNLFFKDILDRSKLGVAVFDRRQTLMYTNLSQNDSEYERVFRSLFKHVPTTLQRGEFQVIRRAREGSLFEITGRAVRWTEDDLAVFYVKRVLSPPQQKAGVVEYYHMLDETREDTRQPIDNIGQMQPVIAAAQRLSQTTAPVCVKGGAGAPFGNVVQTLYHESPFSMSPLVLVDCALIDRKSFLWLLDNADSPLYATRMTVCLGNFSALERALQAQYIHFARCTSLAKRCRVIYTLCEPLALSDAAAAFFNDPGLELLRLPTLRERPEDVAPLASLYLSAINLEVGKQVIGFSREARLLLEGYAWPGNNDQLHRVVRRCLLHAQAEAVTAADVEEALKGERGFHQPAADCSFDLTGTLEEINARVVGAVLAQERMNRSRAAQRLGISRSTLWRMLK